VACVEEEPRPPADAVGASWRYTRGEREWRWGGRDVNWGAQPVAASVGEQMEEGTSGAPVANVARSGVAATSLADTA